MNPENTVHPSIARFSSREDWQVFEGCWRWPRLVCGAYCQRRNLECKCIAMLAQTVNLSELLIFFSTPHKVIIWRTGIFLA